MLILVCPVIQIDNVVLATKLTLLAAVTHVQLGTGRSSPGG